MPNHKKWNSTTERNHAYYLKRQETMKTYSRQRYADNHDEIRDRAKELWAARPKSERQFIAFKNRLALRCKRTPEWYDAKLEEQHGCCALCSRPMGRKRFDVDHDHACCLGRISCGTCIRGLLCSACNTKMGELETLMLEAVIEFAPIPGSWLERALAYIRLYKTDFLSLL